MPISTIPEKLQQTTDEIGIEPETQSIPFVYVEDFKLKLRDVVVTQTQLNSSNSFLLSHPTNGVLGVADGLGGSQIVLGFTTGSTTIEIIRRSYDWKTQDDFGKGTKTNLDTSQGSLQLGNVTVKDILLEHKTK